MKKFSNLILLAAALMLPMQQISAQIAISALPAGAALVGTEAIPAVQSAATVKTTPNAVKALVTGSANTWTATQTFSVTIQGDISGNAATATSATSATSATTASTATNVITVSPSGVTAGTCTACNLTIGLDGRVTTKANGVAGTVTSVDASGANGISISGNPITNTGTLVISLVNATPSTISTGTGTFTNLASASSLPIVAPNGVILSGTNTNDSAAAGKIGEIISSCTTVGSATSLSTGTVINVITLALTAGDWDAEGNINYTATSATVTAGSGGITTTTATVPVDGSEVYDGLVNTTTTTISTIAAPRKRISLSGSANTFLVAKKTFSAGTIKAFGCMTARRVR